MAVKLEIEPRDEDTGSYKDKRHVPRSYPVVHLPIYDVDDPLVEGVVRDLSENGVQVSGISAKVGDRKTFFIQASEFDALNPFSFDSECRWSTTDPDTGVTVSGFEILGISDKDLEQLRLVMDLLALSD